MFGGDSAPLGSATLAATPLAVLTGLAELSNSVAKRASRSLVALGGSMGLGRQRLARYERAGSDFRTSRVLLLERAEALLDRRVFLRLLLRRCDWSAIVLQLIKLIVV